MEEGAHHAEVSARGVVGVLGVAVVGVVVGGGS